MDTYQGVCPSCAQPLSIPATSEYFKCPGCERLLQVPKQETIGMSELLSKMLQSGGQSPLDALRSAASKIGGTEEPFNFGLIFEKFAHVKRIKQGHHYIEVETSIAEVQSSIFGRQPDYEESHEFSCWKSCAAYLRVDVVQSAKCSVGDGKHHHLHFKERVGEFGDVSDISCCWCDFKARVEMSKPLLKGRDFTDLLVDHLEAEIHQHFARYPREDPANSHLGTYESALKLLGRILTDVLTAHQENRPVPSMNLEKAVYQHNLGYTTSALKIFQTMGFSVQERDGAKRMCPPSPLTDDDERKLLHALACVMSAMRGKRYFGDVPVPTFPKGDSYPRFSGNPEVVLRVLEEAHQQYFSVVEAMFGGEYLEDTQFASERFDKYFRKFYLPPDIREDYITPVARCFIMQDPGLANEYLQALGFIAQGRDSDLLLTQYSILCAEIQSGIPMADEGNSSDSPGVDTPKDMPGVWGNAAQHIGFPAEEQWERSIQKLRGKNSPVGLINTKAVCYLNSLLQVFFHSRLFAEAIFGFVAEEPLSRSDKFVLELQMLFGFLCLGNAAAYSPTTVMTRLTQAAEIANPTYQQQDVAEYMTHLLVTVETAFQESPIEDNPSRLFTGVHRHTLTHIANGKTTTKTREEDFGIIHLQTSSQDLVKALCKYIQPSQVADFIVSPSPHDRESPGFPSLVDIDDDSPKPAYCRTAFHILPTYLTFQIVRGQREGGCSVKDSSKLTFPEDLYMDRFVHENYAVYQKLIPQEEELRETVARAREELAVRVAEAEMTEEAALITALDVMKNHNAPSSAIKAVEETLDGVIRQRRETERMIEHCEEKINALYDVPELKRHRYRLHSVTVHVGSSMNAGHVYSFVREGEKWIKFNDEEVCEVPYTVVERTALGEEKADTCAYLLGYVRDGREAEEVLLESRMPTQLKDLILQYNAMLTPE